MKNVRVANRYSKSLIWSCLAGPRLKFVTKKSIIFITITDIELVNVGQ